MYDLLERFKQKNYRGVVFGVAPQREKLSLEEDSLFTFAEAKSYWEIYKTGDPKNAGDAKEDCMHLLPRLLNRTDEVLEFLKEVWEEVTHGFESNFDAAIETLAKEGQTYETAVSCAARFRQEWAKNNPLTVATEFGTRREGKLFRSNQQKKTQEKTRKNPYHLFAMLL